MLTIALKNIEGVLGVKEQDLEKRTIDHGKARQKEFPVQESAER